jgi:hypothetical protein
MKGCETFPLARNGSRNCQRDHNIIITPWDPSLLSSTSQLLWEWGDIVLRLYLILT